MTSRRFALAAVFLCLATSSLAQAPEEETGLPGTAEPGNFYVLIMAGVLVSGLALIVMGIIGSVLGGG